MASKRASKGASTDSLKKAFLIGVGASVVTAEKVGDFVRDVVDDLVERGEMTASDARDLATDLKKRATKKVKQAHIPENVKSFEENIRKNVEAGLKTAVRTLGLVTQDDLKKLRRELGNGKPVAAAKKTVKKAVKKAAKRAKK